MPRLNLGDAGRYRPASHRRGRRRRAALRALQLRRLSLAHRCARGDARVDRDRPPRARAFPGAGGSACHGRV